MDDESELGNKRAMFGDAFGSRGDYSKGFFYGGRRRILVNPPGVKTAAGTLGAPNIPPANYLEPPEMFMTSRQTRKHRQQANDQFQFKLEFISANTSVEEARKDKAAVKKQDGGGKKKVKAAVIVLDKYSSTNPADWTVEHQAGYVNKFEIFFTDLTIFDKL
jgi:hypothetical protein